MSIPSGTDSALARALRDAQTLVELGVPVITGPLDRDGNPTGPRWNGWQRTRPNLRPVERWQPGEAVGAVTGSVFDVIDMDPRNGGQASLTAMADALGDNAPAEYWRVATSSGGRHIYIAPLGLGTHNGFMPGLDLKSAGGFVFVPPTVRPSKAAANAGEPVAYRALTPLARPPRKDMTGGHIRDFITECLAGRNGSGGGQRRALTTLEEACLAAPNGSQRDALLALVTELSRQNDDDEYVVWRVMKVVAEMENFSPRRPWREKDVRGLLYAEGKRPMPDASGEELRDLLEMKDGSGPMVAQAVGGLKRLSTVERKLTEWLWYRYLAFGDASLVDAAAGMSKSTVALDIIARATRGLPMPGEDEAKSGPLNCLLLAPEDREEVLLARVEAAGGDPDKVFIVNFTLRHTRGKRGAKGREVAYLGDQLITFPENVERFHNWIREYGIGLVVIDPISAFLGEGVNPNSDPSVRRALEPFVVVLGMEHCSAWLIRHFNKDRSQSAGHRGGGSVAFGAVARTHLIAGELPTDFDSEATHALAIVKSNNVRRRKGVALGYLIEDSEVEADDAGTMIPRVRWVGEVSVDTDVLANGEKSRRGPEPVTQLRWRELLSGLFAERDRWPVDAVREQAEQAGLSWDHKVYDKVLPDLGIRKVRVAKRGSSRGSADHYWTTRKAKVS